MYLDETVYEVIDSFNLGSEIDKIIEDLLFIEPGIKWTTKWYDYEKINGELTSYITLEVPVEQRDQAFEIYETYQEEIEENCRLLEEKHQKYSQIYEKNDDDEWVFIKEVEEFIDSINYLDQVLTFSKIIPTVETLKSIAKILPEIYTKALVLPEVPVEDEVESMKIEHETEDLFTPPQIFEAYFDYHVDLIKISKSIIGILDELTNFNYFINPPDIEPDDAAGMIKEWNNGFRTSNGWGKRLLKLQLLVHQSIIQMKYELEEYL